MSNCKQCGEKLPKNETGRRPRQFCDNKGKCRNEFHRKNKKAVKKSKTIDLPADYVNWKGVGILKADGTVEELTDISQLPESVQLAVKGMRGLTETINPKKGISKEERYPGIKEGESVLDYQVRMAESKT